MANILPCPFCGSPGRLETTDPGFVRCSSIEVCAGGTWFRLEQWQNRKINHVAAFEQYAESIEVERKFTAEVISLIPAVENALKLMSANFGAGYAQAKVPEITGSLLRLEDSVCRVNQKMKGQ